MDKRELILDAMQQLLQNGKGANCSVSDIARQAGIAKGGMYYYFKSKQEVLDALVGRTYSQIIENCKWAVANTQGNALQKMQTAIFVYTTSVVDSSVDEYLHRPENALIHQKSLAKILMELSDIFAQLIKEGVSQDLFVCEYPSELAQIILSSFCFLLDEGIFNWTPEQIFKKMLAIGAILEHELHLPKGSFDFTKINSKGKQKSYTAYE